jgi:hypothetical protein
MAVTGKGLKKIRNLLRIALNDLNFLGKGHGVKSLFLTKMVGGELLGGS